MRNEEDSIESDRDTLFYRAFLVLDITPPVSREYADSWPPYILTIQFVVCAIDTSSPLRTDTDLVIYRRHAEEYRLTTPKIIQEQRGRE